VRNILSKWKGKLLFYVGRVCLIKSVISYLPLYFLLFFKAPKILCNELIKIQRKFLWNLGFEERKIALIRWDNLCKPKEEEGLGIRDIENFNIALLTKWKWIIGTEDQGVWKEVLESKYGSWRNLC